MKTIYKTVDNKFSVVLPQGVVNFIVKAISKARTHETGGIIFGKYNNNLDCAMISQVTDAPPDSKSGRTWFNRGVKNLQELIMFYWHTKQYYLGEWHYHPSSTPAPSLRDIHQMKAIAKNENYHCPEPILLIIGGTPDHFSIGLYILTRAGSFYALHIESESGVFGR